MTDVTGEAPKGAFFDIAEAAKETEQVVAVVEELRRRFGESALSASAQETLLPLTNKLATAALKIHENLSELEEKEPFGSEDSYWNVFRFFCADVNRGVVRSIEDVWSHVALSFDMGSETPDTLLETLEDWKQDFADDAKAKFKVVGELRQVERGFVFVELLPAPRPPKQQRRTQPSTRKITIEDTEETAAPTIDIVAIVRNLIPPGVHSVKQADVAKVIVSERPDLEYDEVIEEINRLIKDAGVFKYKPKRNQSSYLTLDEEVTRSIDSYDDVRKVEEKTPVELIAEKDIPLSAAIITYVIGTTKHVHEKVSTIKIANNVRKQIPSLGLVETQNVNRLVRALTTYGVMQFDKGAPLRGKGKAKSRSKSRQVMRAGIADQQVREQLKLVAEAGGITEYIEEIITR